MARKLYLTRRFEKKECYFTSIKGVLVDQSCLYFKVFINSLIDSLAIDRADFIGRDIAVDFFG